MRPAAASTGASTAAGGGGPGITRIGQIAVTARDLGRAVRFYRDTLGLPLLFEVSGMAFFDCGGVRLLLGIPQAPEFHAPSSLIYYVVDDIQAAAETLRARGVTFVTAPQRVARLERHDLWLAAFRDSEGNVLELMSEVERR